MRYSLFDTKEASLQFAAKVQAACDKAQQPYQAIIEIFPFPLGERWAVPMPVEPEELEGEVVDRIDPEEIVAEGGESDGQEEER